MTRSLYVWHVGYLPTPNPSCKRQYTDQFLHAVPLTFGRAMSGLQSLELDGPVAPYLIPKFTLALSYFKALNSLRLYIRLNNVAEQMRIIAASPHLTDLGLPFTMDHPEHRISTPKLWPDCSLGIRLRSLSIACSVSATLLIDWLVDSGFVGSLQTLDIMRSSGFSEMAEQVDRVLGAARLSLVSYWEQSAFYATDMGLKTRSHGNLMHNTNLRSLRFEPLMAYPGKWSDGLLRMVDDFVELLATIRGYRLEHISIRLICDLAGDTTNKLRAAFEMLSLKDLHDIMRRPYFGTLKAVEVNIVPSNSHLKGVNPYSGSVGKARADILAYGLLDSLGVRCKAQIHLNPHAFYPEKESQPLKTERRYYAGFESTWTVGHEYMQQLRCTIRYELWLFFYLLLGTDDYIVTFELSFLPDPSIRRSWVLLCTI
ncbi:hypothetical protein EVJ58_g8460 [Rhodofomes roseus]|uniref:Uncharacterized protein n=1 Tax=Rhodofomes roseus TaxID=34475 RepID=A0A4Y9XYB9_9APHY|nr:hypothetical protein EVJ58_g8460 [Rhodofomes roseus]